MDQHSPGVILRDHASIPEPDPREASSELLRIVGETLDMQTDTWDAMTRHEGILTELRETVGRLAETVAAQRGEIGELRARVESQEMRLYLQGEILARHVSPRPGPFAVGPEP